MTETEKWLYEELKKIYDRAIHIDGVIPGIPYMSKALATVLIEKGFTVD